MAYNLVWNDTELVIEFYQEKETNTYIKTYEERLTKEEATQLAQRIMRITNLKMPKKDKLLQPKPTPPTETNNNEDELLK